MQVYAASSRNSYARGLSSPLIFADREASATCACGGESRGMIRSESGPKKTQGVNQLWTRIPKLFVLRLSGQA
jgi:hypothetical protein